MCRVCCVIALLIFVSACNAPVSKPKPSEPYVITSSVVDQANNSLTVSIVLDPPITEENAKSAGEAVINKNRNQFKSVTVKSYASSLQQNLYPYCTSTLSEGTISHQVNKQLEPQKIPSH